MICIAYNEKGQPVSIVNAKSMELAVAYWHGAGTLPFSTGTADDLDPKTNGTGVVPILKTVLINTDGFSRNSGDKVLIIISTKIIKSKNQ